MDTLTHDKSIATALARAASWRAEEEARGRLEIDDVARELTELNGLSSIERYIAGDGEIPERGMDK